MNYKALVLINFLTGIWWFKAQNFDFNRALRFDFQISGTVERTEVYFEQMKMESSYGGSHVNLKMPMYGNFLFQLVDRSTHEILFSKGFNSLFEEWLHSGNTEDKKLFYHAIQAPFPKKDMDLVISERKSDGSFQPIYRRGLSPDDYFIKKEKVRHFPVKVILENGVPNQKVDIAVIAEGYTYQELEKFYEDAHRLVDYMFTIPPYDQYKNRFNIYAVGAISEESGTDIPGQHIYKNTIINSSFYTFDMARYLTSNDVSTIADIASLVPYDQIFVIANTSNYGGAGFYNHLNLVSAGHRLSPEVFVHEFGHGFVGLADEYYTSGTSFSSIYNLKLEPWEPNITTLVDFEKKWKHMIDEYTPIPTPRSYEYKNTIGVFEGGGYVDKGIYSPVQDCRMKSNEAKGFCPVCSKAIGKTIDFYTE